MGTGARWGAGEQCNGMQCRATKQVDERRTGSVYHVRYESAASVDVDLGTNTSDKMVGTPARDHREHRPRRTLCDITWVPLVISRSNMLCLRWRVQCEDRDHSHVARGQRSEPVRTDLKSTCCTRPIEYTDGMLQVMPEGIEQRRKSENAGSGAMAG